MPNLSLAPMSTAPGWNGWPIHRTHIAPACPEVSGDNPSPAHTGHHWGSPKFSDFFAGKSTQNPEKFKQGLYFLPVKRGNLKNKIFNLDGNLVPATVELSSSW